MRVLGSASSAPPMSSPESIFFNVMTKCNLAFRASNGLIFYTSKMNHEGSSINVLTPSTTVSKEIQHWKFYGSATKPKRAPFVSTTFNELECPSAGYVGLLETEGFALVARSMELPRGTHDQRILPDSIYSERSRGN